ncbi:hypothetical protein Ndes2437B_g03354 [Nannochloris sp. 'desiccata']
MTRFVGDAIGVRKAATGYTSKDRKRDMDAFLETGMHPEVKRMRESEAFGRPMPPLPTPLRSRPHIFFQFSISRKDVGRVVVELFDDILPAPTRHVQARCTAAARDTFAGTFIHKILGGTSIYGGKSKHFTDTVSMKRDASLRHVAPGTLSVSSDGSEPVIIEKCGLTDADGVVDVEVAGGKSGIEGVAGRGDGEGVLEREEDETRNAVQAALEAQGKKQQQKPQQAGGGAAKKKGAFDAVLLGSSNDDSSDDES